MLANFSWFLFGFNYGITNILKPYQPTKLSRTTAETFLKRPGLQASFNSYYVVWMSIICTIFIKCFLSIFIIEHTCLYYLQTEISINLIGSLGSLFCPSEFKGKHVQGRREKGAVCKCCTCTLPSFLQTQYQNIPGNFNRIFVTLYKK